MNCRAAQRLLSAERDGALTPHERADLETHVSRCADCRRARAVVAEAVEGWRQEAAHVKTPDVERAWQDIRREIRSAPAAGSQRQTAAWRWALPVGVLAALALAMITPRLFEKSPPTSVARLERARADFVEVPKDVSSVVYVDDKSGWLVVWADAGNPPSM